MVDSIWTQNDTTVSVLSTNIKVNSSTKSYTGTRQGLMNKDTEAERPTVLLTVVSYQ